MGSWAQAQQLWCMGLVVPQHVGSSWTRDGAHVPCIGRLISNHWTTREVPPGLIFKFFLNFTYLIFFTFFFFSLRIFTPVACKVVGLFCWNKHCWRYYYVLLPLGQGLTQKDNWTSACLMTVPGWTWTLLCDPTTQS